MGSEISSDRGNAQDLRDLQESYKKRRQAVEDEGREDVQKARQSNQQQLRGEMTSGQAAVNHVRASNQERLDQAKADIDQHLTYERKSLARGIQSERQHGKEELDSLHDNLSARNEQLRQQIHEEDKKESVQRQRGNQETNAVAQEQALHRAKIMRQEQEEMSNFGKKVETQKQAVSEKSHTELNQLNEKSQHELQHMQIETKKVYDKQAQEGHRQLDHQRGNQSKQLEFDRAEFSKNEANLRDHAHKQLIDEQINDNEKFAKVKKQNEVDVTRTREKGTKNMEQVRGYYDKNIARIEKTGDAKVHEQNEIQEKRLREQDQEHKAVLQKVRGEHEDELATDDQTFHKQATNNKESYRQSLTEQRKQYDIAFKKNLEAFQAQVHNQHDLFTESVAKEKRKVIDDVGKYNNRNGDPFYRLADPKASVQETPTHYVIKTKVPEHEKDNVKVTVHEDKVIVHGARQFADNVEDTDGKIATNSYQTYRQEIPLDHPVVEKAAHREWKDGILTVRIPKA
jgi:HSP20 family molecular chaperone IbpA